MAQKFRNQVIKALMILAPITKCTFNTIMKDLIQFIQQLNIYFVIAHKELNKDRQTD